MTLVEEPVPEWVEEALATAARRVSFEDRAVVAERHAARFQRLIREQRNWLAELAELLAEGEKTQSFAVDGHRAVTGWCRALSSCSVGQAGGWRRIARLCAALPEVQAALAEGRVGVEHVQELARAFANPRVRSQFPEYIDALLADAARSSLEAFRATVLQWERLLDQDGPEPEDRKS